MQNALPKTHKNVNILMRKKKKAQWQSGKVEKDKDFTKEDIQMANKKDIELH